MKRHIHIEKKNNLSLSSSNFHQSLVICHGRSLGTYACVYPGKLQLHCYCDSY